MVAGIADGSIDLNSPQTTLALLKLNAVVGLRGEVVDNSDGSMSLKGVAITCALCHSTVSSDVEVRNDARDVVLPAGIAGHRLDVGRTGISTRGQSSDSPIWHNHSGGTPGIQRWN